MWILIRTDDTEEVVINIDKVHLISKHFSECIGYYIALDFGSHVYRLAFKYKVDELKAYHTILDILQHPDGAKLIDLKISRVKLDY